MKGIGKFLTGAEGKRLFLETFSQKRCPNMSAAVVKTLEGEAAAAAKSKQQVEHRHACAVASIKRIANLMLVWKKAAKNEAWLCDMVQFSVGEWSWRCDAATQIAWAAALDTNERRPICACSSSSDVSGLRHMNCTLWHAIAIHDPARRIHTCIITPG